MDIDAASTSFETRLEERPQRVHGVAGYHWHSLQNLIIDRDKHLVLAIDEAVGKLGFDLNEVIDARNVKSIMGLFDTVPRLQVVDVGLNIETWVALDDYICDQGILCRCDRLALFGIAEFGTYSVPPFETGNSQDLRLYV